MKTEHVTRIITLDDEGHCLTSAAQAISETPEGLLKARGIIKSLTDILRSHAPAAGLAAPQIGISKQVFIFSWDRSFEHLDAAINPSFKAMCEEKTMGWEGCFSVPLALAYVPRYQTILATYTDGEGKKVTYKLQGFAARVFQHEYDHLQGIENIHRPDADVKKFETQEALNVFIQDVKKADVVNYIKPEKR